MDSAPGQQRQVGRRVALAVLTLIAVLSVGGSVVGVGTAKAGYAPQAPKATPGWHYIDTNAVGYFAPSKYGTGVGEYTGRWMVGTQYEAMVNRMAKGVQSLGTGAGTGYSGNASNGVAIAEKLKTVATGAGTIATVRSLKGDTLGLMARLKSFGLLKSLGTIALAASSFEVGWKVGSKIAGLLGFTNSSEENKAPSGAFELTAKSVVYKEVGENLCVEPTASGPCVTGQTLPAPEPLVIVNYEPKTGGLRQAFQEGRGAVSGGKCTPDYALSKTPEGAEPLLLGTTQSSCSGTKYEIPTVIMVAPVTVTHLPGEVGGPYTPEKETAGQTPVNQPSAETIVKECLAALACAKLGGWWWNHDPEAKEATHHEGFHMGLDPVDPLSVQIPVPDKGEKVGPYAERLEALGLDPEPVALGEAFVDPRVGPEGVSATVPHIGSNVDPETKVRVRYNPAGAPEGSEETETEPEEEVGTGGGTGGWSPPTIPALEMPGGVPSPCTVFPFGVLCWLGEALAQFNTSGICPHFSAPVAETGSNFEVTLCGETSEIIMDYLRPAILLVFTIGVGFLFARATKAVGGD